MIAYYYCSLDVFLNIIKNREIYLSDPLKMNDSSEIRWCLDLLNDNQEENKYNCDSVFGRMKSRANVKLEYKELIHMLEKEGQDIVFIACFSKEHDLLSQWRAYADNGEGVAIGFNIENLIGENGNITYYEVEYSDRFNENAEDENAVEIVADEIGGFIKNGIMDEERKKEIFLTELIDVLVRYKNPVFKDEKEIRIIYNDKSECNRIMGWYDEKGVLEHDFRLLKSGMITEYVKLKFCPEAIEKIYIGPKCRLKKSDVSRMMNHYLKNNESETETSKKYSEVDIEKSKATYRG